MRAIEPATLLVGCGNPLRGDDGVGPEVVRRLSAHGIPRIRCIDTGTSGADVVLAMRGRDEVIIIDACRSGAPAGTIHEIDVRPSLVGPVGLAIHGFSWEHAVALGRTLLADTFPRRVSALLIEGTRFGPGDRLSPPAESAVAAVVARLVTRFADPQVLPTAQADRHPRGR